MSGRVELLALDQPEWRMLGNEPAVFAGRRELLLGDQVGAAPPARTVRAHTLPERNASVRILAKLGFAHLGQVVDPEDGPVWRWERALGSSPA